MLDSNQPEVVGRSVVKYIEWNPHPQLYKDSLVHTEIVEWERDPHNDPATWGLGRHGYRTFELVFFEIREGDSVLVAVVDQRFNQSPCLYRSGVVEPTAGGPMSKAAEAIGNPPFILLFGRGWQEIIFPLYPGDLVKRCRCDKPPICWSDLMK